MLRLALISVGEGGIKVEICLTIPDTDLTLQLTETAADATLPAYATLRPLPATSVAPLVFLMSILRPF
jgi:hypothetical protein